jgi:hypothetical protein
MTASSNFGLNPGQTVGTVRIMGFPCFHFELFGV